MNPIPTAIAALVATALLLHAEPQGTPYRPDPPEPPSNAPAGKKIDGVRIGIWTKKAVYSTGEVPLIWIFAWRDRGSAITIGVGGSVFTNSTLYAFKNGNLAARTDTGSPIDGFVDTSYFAGGSGFPKKLPPGSYVLIWKAGKLKSNSLKITIQ